MLSRHEKKMPHLEDAPMKNRFRTKYINMYEYDALIFSCDIKQWVLLPTIYHAIFLDNMLYYACHK